MDNKFDPDRNLYNNASSSPDDDDEVKVVHNEISPSDMLKFFHLRYNHLTGLRSITARHYLTLIGFLALVMAAFIRFGGSQGEQKIWIASHRIEIAMFLLFLSLVGLFNIIYDTMCRKVADGSCNAIEFLIENHFKFKKQMDEHKVASDSSNQSLKLVGEELFFSSSIIMVDAGLFSIAAYLFFMSDSQCNPGGHFCSLCEVLMITSFFMLFIALIIAIRRFVFTYYYCPPWALPCSKNRSDKK